MVAYIIADVEVTDAARYESYRSLSSAAIQKHGARIRVRGGQAEPLEGRRPGRTVILEFDSAEAARQFYNSPEYAKARAARAGAAVMNMFIVEGA